MGSRTFTVSARFYWHEILYVVERLLPDEELLLQAELSGQVQIAKAIDLRQALYAGNLRFLLEAEKSNGSETTSTFAYPSLEDCPAHLAQIARVRWDLLLDLYGRPRTEQQLKEHLLKFLENCTEEEAKALGGQVSVRTMYRWLARLEVYEGDIRSLIPTTQRCGAKEQGRLNAAVEQIMLDAEDVVLKGESTNALHDEIRLRIRHYNEKQPDESSIALPSRATVARRRLGRRKSKEKDGQDWEIEKQYGRFELPELPLERVEIDHTPSDLIVVDDEDNLPIGRLTLTYCVDVKTRLVLGYYLGFEPPSYLAVAECLYQAILPKVDTRLLYDTENSLEGVHGVPFALATDNGKEFESRHFSDALALLGIRHDTMPRLAPQKKPFVERLFGTLNSGLFHIAPGTTLSNILQRRKQGSREEACVYLSQIDRALTLFLVDIYAQDSHAGLDGKTPMQLWQEAISNGFEPRLPRSAEDLHILLGRTAQRVLDRNGFTFERIRYNSNTAELRRLRQRLGGRGEVKLKYHPSDLSQMYVYDPFERRYLKVAALDQEWTQRLSLWKHRLILQIAREDEQAVDREALARARRKIRDIFEEGAYRKRYGRWKTNGESLSQLGKQSQVKPTEIELDESHPNWDILLQSNIQRAAQWAREENLDKVEGTGDA